MPIETNIPMAFMSPSVTKLLPSSDMLIHFVGGGMEGLRLLSIPLSPNLTPKNTGQTGAGKHEGNDLTNWKGLRSPISIESLLV